MISERAKVDDFSPSDDFWASVLVEVSTDCTGGEVEKQFRTIETWFKAWFRNGRKNGSNLERNWFETDQETDPFETDNRFSRASVSTARNET